MSRWAIGNVVSQADNEKLILVARKCLRILRAVVELVLEREILKIIRSGVLQHSNDFNDFPPAAFADHSVPNYVGGALVRLLRCFSDA